MLNLWEQPPGWPTPPNEPNSRTLPSEPTAKTAPTGHCRQTGRTGPTLRSTPTTPRMRTEPTLEQLPWPTARQRLPNAPSMRTTLRSWRRRNSRSAPTGPNSRSTHSMATPAGVRWTHCQTLRHRQIQRHRPVERRCSAQQRYRRCGHSGLARPDAGPPRPAWPVRRRENSTRHRSPPSHWSKPSAWLPCPCLRRLCRRRSCRPCSWAHCPVLRPSPHQQRPSGRRILCWHLSLFVLLDTVISREVSGLGCCHRIVLDRLR